MKLLWLPFKIRGCASAQIKSKEFTERQSHDPNDVSVMHLEITESHHSQPQKRMDKWNQERIQHWPMISRKTQNNKEKLRRELVELKPL